MQHSQKIRESFKEQSEGNSSNSEIVEQKNKIATKSLKLDELIRDSLSLDDLIT